MAIIFENIHTGETVAINQESEGKFYRAKLSAVMNSSNLSLNADRGQDYGWRLQPEQQAILEEWEVSPDMIDKVATFSRVPLDALSHAEFLSYLLYQQELGRSPEQSEQAAHRENQLAYDARVAALKSQEVLEAVPAFKPLTLEEFMGPEEVLAADVKAELDALIVEGETTVEAAPKTAPKAKK